MTESRAERTDEAPARLSFRSTVANLKKVTEIARRKGWFNAQNKPNVSRVLNYLIDRFDMSAEARDGKDNGRGRR